MKKTVFYTFQHLRWDDALEKYSDRWIFSNWDNIASAAISKNLIKRIAKQAIMDFWI